MREVMMNNEASLGEMEIGENQTAAYLRRLYLMDIYRFFRLFPNRNAMNNPFEGNHSDDDILNVFESELFMQTPLDGYKASVVRMMKKHHFDKMACGVLNTFPESMRDAQYYIWTNSYEKALEIEPDNVRALAGAARWQFSRGNYAQADEYYDRLLLLQPDKVSYKLNKAVCLVKMEDNEEALKLLYQLDYEHAEDANIQRVFAWALTCDGKLEQAEKVFVQLLAEHHATGEDYLNYGYCLWLMNSIDDAAANFRKYMEMTPAEQRNDPLFDFWWLKKRGVDIIQYRMMETLVQS
jgi:tetratricopeptide (TPR) repeat protein